MSRLVGAVVLNPLAMWDGSVLRALVQLVPKLTENTLHWPL
jgi:hypothetical protein